MGRVLISNDDGISADGIAALARLANNFFDEVWIVAPKEEASQIGHRVTTHRPLGFEKRGERSFAIDGSPADCIRAGLHLMGDSKPDWVWTGINHGGNLGRHDYYISGTLAAAREAAFFGIKAMGTSQYLKQGLEQNWEKAASRVGKVFDEIKDDPLEHGEFWNINLPHIGPDEAEPDHVFCHPERQPLHVVFEKSADEESLIYRDNYHERLRSEGSDVDACFGGKIAVSKLVV